MEKFELDGYTYDIIETFETTDHEGHNDYEVKKTSKTVLSYIYPLIIHGKFRWFKKTQVRSRLYLSRKKDFDDGWSYKYFWTKWKKELRIEQVIISRLL